MGGVAFLPSRVESGIPRCQSVTVTVLLILDVLPTNPAALLSSQKRSTLNYQRCQRLQIVITMRPKDAPVFLTRLKLYRLLIYWISITHQLISTTCR